MEGLFLHIVNISLVASWLVLVILAVRLVFRKAPKWSVCLLWSFVAIRLVFPFSIESALSLIPSAEPLPQDIIYTAKPQVDTGISSINSVINPVIAELLAPEPVASANPTQIWSFVFSRIWIAGAAVMFFYALLSWWILRSKLATATLLQKGIKQSEQIDSPFVLGIIRPVIYLPYQIDGTDRKYVIAHEQAHMTRKDHWWKLLGLMLLSIYWFNPMMWVAYIFLCRDIEAACDEKVIKEMEEDGKRAYSTALLNCSVRHRLMAACPLAFGEIGVKERVKNVMNYKKPALWVVFIALLICIVIAICFLTNPQNEAKPDNYHYNNTQVADTVEEGDMFFLVGEDYIESFGSAGMYFEGTMFFYNGTGYDIARRNENVNAITGCSAVGDYVVVDGHVCPQNGVYCIFNGVTETFEKDIIGGNLVWRDDDITTAVYSFWSSIFDYSGKEIASLDIPDGAFIKQISFIDDNKRIEVMIYEETGDTYSVIIDL